MDTKKKKQMAATKMRANAKAECSAVHAGVGFWTMAVQQCSFYQNISPTDSSYVDVTWLDT
jgi:hypothetical protein